MGERVGEVLAVGAGAMCSGEHPGGAGGWQHWRDYTNELMNSQHLDVGGWSLDRNQSRSNIE
jgi:hypothetical protein